MYLVITCHFSGHVEQSICCMCVHVFHQDIWHAASYRLRGSNAPWFMCWFRRSLNCLFLSFLFPSFLLYFLLSLCFLSFLFTSLLVYFLIYLSTPSRIDQFRFQARGRKEVTKPGFSFFGFIICCSTFVMDSCLLVAFISVFQY